MQINIDEDELQKWAVSQIQKRMGDRINALMRDWDWHSYMREAVDKAVIEKVSDAAIKNLVENLDKDKLIKTVSERVAKEIADNL